MPLTGFEDRGRHQPNMRSRRSFGRGLQRLRTRFSVSCLGRAAPKESSGEDRYPQLTQRTTNAHAIEVFPRTRSVCSVNSKSRLSVYLPRPAR